MYSLLTSWGYAVVAAGSGAEIMTLLLRSALRPDLIICDYRLRDKKTESTLSSSFNPMQRGGAGDANYRGYGRGPSHRSASERLTFASQTGA